MTLLGVKNLRVKIEGSEILKGVSLSVNRGEIHLIFGPNGSGKSTLLKAIMGLPEYEVVSGDIIFEGRSLVGLPPYERAKLGIALAFQNPPTIHVKLEDLALRLARRFKSDLGLLDELALRDLVSRRLHDGFSGGESKRVELALALLQNPRLLLLDEPDSGVDVDSLRIVTRAINKAVDHGTSVILVTHSGHIARLLKRVDAAHVLIKGRIVHTGSAKEILDILESYGYSYFRQVSG